MASRSPGAEPRRRKVSARYAAWLEKYLRVPGGLKEGQPLRLTRHQRAWLAAIFDTPTRRFILTMGRKNGKTPFTAMLMLLHLVGPAARRNTQLYSSAVARDQAAIVFDYAARMVRMSQDLNRYVQIRESAKQMLCPELGTSYRALSAEASTAYGLSPALVIHDELGQVRGPRSDLYEALETASGATVKPLSIIISTQAPNPTDLLSTLIDKALEDGAPPTTKCVVYSAPEDADPFSLEAVRAANPHYDFFMNREEVREQIETARRLPSAEASYRNLILNQRVESHQPFISRSVWQENGVPPRPANGQEWFVGLDLSAVADLCACLELTAEGDVAPTFWLPAEGLAERSRADRVPYDVWQRQGLLHTTPGRTIEYEFVAEHLLRLFRSKNIKAVAFDRWNMRFLMPWLVKVGFSDEELKRFVEFGQGFKDMSPALRAVEAKLLARKYRHGNHPVLAMCAANAVVVADPAGNRKFSKVKATGRIDGMVALAMAEGVIPQQPPAQEFQMMVLG